MKGRQIHEFSRIAGVVDRYDAVTVDRVYRRAIPPNEAWEMISGSGGYLFDYEITKAFLSHVAAYPVCTIVLLGGQRAVKA
ncbi:MAG: HD-GYP domain-containing protein [Bacillota bacterium]